MPVQHNSFTGRIKGRANVLLSYIEIAPTFTSSNPGQIPPSQKYQAIWDTGATTTAITAKVVKDCSLKPIGMTQVKTAGGLKHCNVYIVNVSLPNKVIIHNVKVTGLDALAGDSEILIGMDIICQGDFAVTNHKGKTTFSFRVPSLEEIDFVTRKPPGTEPARSNKVPRNSPCPCGSGKKYKKCHGK